MALAAAGTAATKAASTARRDVPSSAADMTGEELWPTPRTASGAAAGANAEAEPTSPQRARDFSIDLGMRGRKRPAQFRVY